MFHPKILQSPLPLSRVTAANGIATFSNLTLSKAGSYILRATNGGISVYSDPINVGAVATHVSLTSSANPSAVSQLVNFTATVSTSANFIPEVDWTRDANVNIEGGGFAVNRDGNVFVAGDPTVANPTASALTKFDTEGNHLWTIDIGIGMSIEALATDADGNVYLTGWDGPFDQPENPNTYLAKFDADGDPVWSHTIIYHSEIDSLTLDASGDIYLGGSVALPGDFGDASVLKFNSAGNLVWDRYVENPEDGFGINTYEVSIDSLGRILAVASSGISTVYDEDGDVLFTIENGGGSICGDGAGNVYVAHLGDGFFPGLYLTKFDTNGDSVWTRQMDDGEDLGFVRFVEGGLFLTFSKTTWAGSDTFLTRLNVDGDILWARPLGLTEIAFHRGLQLDAAGNIYSTSSLRTSWPDPYTVFVTKLVPGHASAGTVTFKNGAAALDDVAVSADGTATFSTAALAAGSHSITAVFSANGYTSSTSEILTQTIATSSVHPVFTQQPTVVVAGSVITSAIVVTLKDDGGNVLDVDTDVTLEFGTNTTSALLGGTLTRQAVHGVATFDNIAITTAGSYTLIASDGAAGFQTSSAFVVSPDTASAHLVVTQNPDTVVGKVITPSLVVKVQDQFDNVITTNNPTITLAIDSGPGILKGKLTAVAAKGIGTFAGLSASVAGTYSLKVSTPNVNGGAPTLFDQEILKATATIAKPAVAAAYIFGKPITVSGTVKSGAPRQFSTPARQPSLTRTTMHLALPRSAPLAWRKSDLIMFQSASTHAHSTTSATRITPALSRPNSL